MLWKCLAAVLVLAGMAMAQDPTDNPTANNTVEDRGLALRRGRLSKVIDGDTVELWIMGHYGTGEPNQFKVTADLTGRPLSVNGLTAHPGAFEFNKLWFKTHTAPQLPGPWKKWPLYLTFFKTTDGTPLYEVHILEFGVSAISLTDELYANGLATPNP